MKKVLVIIIISVLSIILPMSFAHADVNSNLAAWYTFDRNTIPQYINGGKVWDRSGNGVHGSIVIGSIDLGGAASSTLGRVAQAINFRGITNSINGGMNLPTGSLVIGTGDFSVSVWTKACNNAFSTIVATYNSGPSNNGYAMYWNSGALLWAIEQAGRGSNLPTQSVTMDCRTWHHFVGTYSQVAAATTTIILYVDGVQKQIQNTNVPAGNVTNAHAPVVGRTFASNPAQNISMDELRFYSRALNTNEINQLYRMGRAIYMTP